MASPASAEDETASRNLTALGPFAGGGAMGAAMAAYDWALLAARTRDRLAAEPEDRGRHHADLALPDVDALGTGAHLLLQRRLPADPGCQGRVGAGRALGPGLGRDLARDRAADRDGDDRRHRHLGRGAAPLPRAQRLPGGNLPHLLLQPVARRFRPHRRHAVRGHRGDRAAHRRAPAGDPGHARQRAREGPDRGGTGRGHRAWDRRQWPRSAFHPGLSVRRAGLGGAARDQCGDPRRRSRRTGAAAPRRCGGTLARGRADADRRGRAGRGPRRTGSAAERRLGAAGPPGPALSDRPAGPGRARRLPGHRAEPVPPL